MMARLRTLRAIVGTLVFLCMSLEGCALLQNTRVARLAVARLDNGSTVVLSSSRSDSLVGTTCSLVLDWQQRSTSHRLESAVPKSVVSEEDLRLRVEGTPPRACVIDERTGDPIFSADFGSSTAWMYGEQQPQWARDSEK